MNSIRPKRKSKSKKNLKKPSRPPGSPLFAHATGRWCKKIRGKHWYFGTWEKGHGAALKKYLDEKDDILADRPVRVKESVPTVADLCNHFRNGKRKRMDRGKIKLQTYREYVETTDKLVDGFGAKRELPSITDEDFGRLYDRFRVGQNGHDRSLASLAKDIRLVRMVFRYGEKKFFGGKTVDFGDEFDPPEKADLREESRLKGPRMFESDEMRLIIDALSGKVEISVEKHDKKTNCTEEVKLIIKANPILRAMVVLSLNTAFGQTDVSNLPIESVDFDSGWIDFSRVKTKIPRRIPLWPETVQFLLEALELRPDPIDPDDAGLLFLTQRGDRWVRDSRGDKQTWKDAIGLEFGKLLRKLDLKRPGLNFYALRHTFQTIADDCRDFVAVRSVMGHSDPSMSAVYRERVSDDRLREAVNTVRSWLWPDTTAKM